MRTRALASGCKVFDGLLGLVLAVAAIAYLTYAMLRPENF